MISDTVIGTPVLSVAVAPRPPDLAVSDIAGLKNLTAAQLKDRFGKPDVTLIDVPAQIWQYRDSSCVLMVFLDDVNGEKRVTHAVTRSRTNLNAAENSCTPAVQTAQN